MPSPNWYCPVYGRDIAEGLCIEINHERIGLASLEEVKKTTGKIEPEISNTCKSCSNMPISDEGMNEIFKAHDN